MKSGQRKTHGNRFFNDNAITPISRIFSYSSHRSKHHVSEFASSMQNSRIVRSSSVKLNPNKFIHREVFNSSLYQGKNQSKMFNIQLNKQQKHVLKIKQEQLYFRQIFKNIEESQLYHDQKFKKMYENLQHHAQILSKFINDIEQSEQIKNILDSTFKTISQIFSFMSDTLKHKQIQCKNQQKSLAFIKAAQQKIRPSTQQFTTQSLSRIKDQSIQHNLLNKCKVKYNVLQFQHKKQILKCEALQQQIQIAKQTISKLLQQNNQMIEQKNSIQKWREEYQYKIRKLKQQLEVAHIVKDQNLQEKVNYILGWKI